MSSDEYSGGCRLSLSRCFQAVHLCLYRLPRNAFLCSIVITDGPNRELASHHLDLPGEVVLQHRANQIRCEAQADCFIIRKRQTAKTSDLSLTRFARMPMGQTLVHWESICARVFHALVHCRSTIICVTLWRMDIGAIISVCTRVSTKYFGNVMGTMSTFTNSRVKI